MKAKEESERAGLKLNIIKTKIMASSPHYFIANRRVISVQFSHSVASDSL